MTVAVEQKKHVRLLFVLAVASRVLTCGLLHSSSSFLPLFDSSPSIVTSKATCSLLRWDLFHFAHIAENGYRYEHDWAFFPGTPLLMRCAASTISLLKGANGTSWADLLVGGTALALVCDTTITMYHLSLHHLRSPSLALLASLLSLIPSSPATLWCVPYSEPFFTYLSYKGMLCSARSQWFTAAVFFAMAGTFRSNGVLLSGFIVWGLIIQPVVDGKKPSIKPFLYSVLLTGMVSAPFVYHHITAYMQFCTTAQPASWCSNRPPSIYTHVQSTYWNVGFLRYWTLQQLPNFIISAPPLTSLSYFCIYHIKHRFFSVKSSQTSSSASINIPFLSPSLTPHAIHALFLCTTLLLNSHTQIILRLGPSMPITYWSAAWLMVAWPSYGRMWVAWSVIWGAVSLVLWAAFLPPA